MQQGPEEVPTPTLRFHKVEVLDLVMGYTASFPSWPWNESAAWIGGILDSCGYDAVLPVPAETVAQWNLNVGVGASSGPCCILHIGLVGHDDGHVGLGPWAVHPKSLEGLIEGPFAGWGQI